MKRKLSKKQQKWEDTVKDYATALFIIRHGCNPTDAEVQELLTTPEFRILLFSQLFYSTIWHGNKEVNNEKRISRNSRLDDV